MSLKDTHHSNKSDEKLLPQREALFFTNFMSKDMGSYKSSHILASHLSQFSNPLFLYHFLNTPEGCYDSLNLVDKLTLL